MRREPPCASSTAVRFASPSLPGRSSAEPVMKSMRNEMSGEREGSSTSALLAAPFVVVVPRLVPRGADLRCASVGMAAVHALREAVAKTRARVGQILLRHKLGRVAFERVENLLLDVSHVLLVLDAGESGEEFLILVILCARVQRINLLLFDDEPLIEI